jgi:hypothetical protein
MTMKLSKLLEDAKVHLKTQDGGVLSTPNRNKLHHAKSLIDVIGDNKTVDDLCKELGNTSSLFYDVYKLPDDWKSAGTISTCFKHLGEVLELPIFMETVACRQHIDDLYKYYKHKSAAKIQEKFEKLGIRIKKVSRSRKSKHEPVPNFDQTTAPVNQKPPKNKTNVVVEKVEENDEDTDSDVSDFSDTSSQKTNIETDASPELDSSCITIAKDVIAAHNTILILTEELEKLQEALAPNMPVTAQSIKRIIDNVQAYKFSSVWKDILQNAK